MELRNFTESTKKLYLCIARRLSKHFNRDPEKITSDEIKDYILHLQNNQKLASATVYGYINAYRFLINHSLKRTSDPFDMPRRKREHKLPEILSKEELQLLFACAGNMKKRTMLMTMYSAGLRVGDLVKLQVKDINSNRMMIHVKGGKGRKDRYTLLTPSLLKQLRFYYKKYRPTSYLFYNRKKDNSYDAIVPYRAFREAQKSAGISKGRGTHTLRHCFATHLLEAGVDLRTIQVLMGHTTIDTTSKYLKVTDKKLESVRVAVDLLSESA